MVYENLPMEMSPEWKAITKCESRIEALEKKLFENSGDPEIIKNHAEQIAELKGKYELNEQQYKIIYNRQENLESVLKDIKEVVLEMLDHHNGVFEDKWTEEMRKTLSAKDEKPPEPFGMKGDFKREEVHQLILEAVKNGNNILIATFIKDVKTMTKEEVIEKYENM